MDASQALGLLQNALLELKASVCQRHGIPDENVIVIVAPKGQRSVNGWFAPERWVDKVEGRSLHEIVIAAERLDRDTEAVATTLVHEIVHLAAQQRGIKDTSRQGRWHNHRFGELAFGEFGLRVSAPEEPCGVRTVGLKPETAHTYARELQVLDRALRLYRREPERPALQPPVPLGIESGSTGATASSRSNRSLRAACDCTVGRDRRRSITVRASDWEAGTIECRICGAVFAEKGGAR